MILELCCLGQRVLEGSQEGCPNGEQNMSDFSRRQNRALTWSQAWRRGLYELLVPGDSSTLWSLPRGTRGSSCFFRTVCLVPGPCPPGAVGLEGVRSGTTGPSAGLQEEFRCRRVGQWCSSPLTLSCGSLRNRGLQTQDTLEGLCLGERLERPTLLGQTPGLCDDGNKVFRFKCLDHI